MSSLAPLAPAVGLVDTRNQYSRVFDLYIPIALAVFGIVLLVVLFLMLKNRRRTPGQASRRSSNDRLEGTYAFLLVLIVVGLLWLTYSAEHQTDTVANSEHPALTIHVIAAKWEWTFQYPAYQITIYSGTTGQRTVVVPVGEPVRFTLSSQDVIHAFWIPELRYKHDLIAGLTQSETLVFPRPGTFQGQCAEFCGLRHDDMVYTVEAVSPARFRAWAAAGGKAPVT